MLFNRDSAIQKCFQKIPCKAENLVPCKPSRQRVILSGCPSVQSASCPDDVSYRLNAHLQSIIRPNDENFPSGPSPVSRSFELLQLAFVRTFQQHVRTTLSVRQASGFLSKAQLWEDPCNRLDNVDSRPGALIHKASIAFKIQTSGHKSALSGRPCFRYGNCVHQINNPDDHSPGPDVRSLYMEITSSGSAAV
jgi:hypothetical protein